MRPLPSLEAISKRNARELARARVKSSSPTESFWKIRYSSLRRKSGLGRAKVLVGHGKQLPAPAKNEFDRSRVVFSLVEPLISKTWLCGCSGASRGSNPDFQTNRPIDPGGRGSAALGPDLLRSTELAGFATVRGGPTSHVAILARSMGMPAVAGLPVAALALTDGEEIVLNGDDGLLETKPTSERLEKIRDVRRQRDAIRVESRKMAHEPALTRDKTRIEIAANIGGASDAREAVKSKLTTESVCSGPSFCSWIAPNPPPRRST